MPLLDLARIMSAAADLRMEAGLKKPPYNSKRLMEICFPDVIVTGAPLPNGVHELVHVNSNGKRTILYNRKLPTTAHRVGIVHGLAHLLFDELHLRGERSCTLNLSPTRHHEHEEIRADLFAGEILVPFVDLDRVLDCSLAPKTDAEKRHFADLLDHGASTFKVPVPFVRRRARDLRQLRKTRFFVTPVKP